MNNKFKAISELQKEYANKIKDIKDRVGINYQQEQIDKTNVEYNNKLTIAKNELSNLLEKYVLENKPYKAIDGDITQVLNVINSVRADTLPIEIDNFIIDRLKDDVQANSIVNSILKANEIRRPVNPRIKETVPKLEKLQRTQRNISSIDLSLPLIYAKLAVENITNEPINVDVGGIGKVLAQKQITAHNLTSL